MSSGGSWRSLLLRIGDKCPEYGGSTDDKEHIDTCYSALLREWDNSKDDIFELLLQCAEQLPHKIPFYGVMVGLINLENDNFAKRLVDEAHSRFQDALYSGNCNRIRILLRFLTVLMCSNVILPASLVGIFETLLSSAATTINEDVGNPSWQSCADFYITSILSSLPWGGAELVEQVPDDFERVMVGIQSYLSIRCLSQDTGLAVFEIEEDKISERKDFLEDLWDRIQVLVSNGWKAESVPRPHLTYESQLVAGSSHALSPVICPEQPAVPSSRSTVAVEKEKHEAMLKYPQRLRRLNIFPSIKSENMQPIDRFVVEEYLLDMLFFFNGCRKECASFMASLRVPFRYEYLMAETIFSQLLLLPRAPFKPLYYTLVIIDLCKALPGAFPAVVVAAVRALFDRIDDMDMECRTRLILWFSQHLSNFQYIWPWGEWAYVKDLPRWAPRRVFVQEVLEREIRLSYWDRIKQSVENAPELEELLPPKGGPNFKYNREDGRESSEGHALSAEFSSMVKARKSVQQLISWAEESIIPAHGYKVAVEVVIQTLLDIGSKSFTHLITVLERYGQVIAKLCPPEHDSQYLLIEEVGHYWKNNTQMIAITIDRMMGYRLISNLAIVSWVFSSSNVDQFHLSDHPWEDTCYSALLREWDNSKDDIFELLLQCTEQLPHKIPFYGLMVGLINLENENFAKRLVDEAHSWFQDALYSGNCNRIHILLRFLTMLMCSNVILPASIVGIFETLLSSAATTIDEDVGNPSWQSRADFYITSILSSLPWGGAELVEDFLQDLWDRIQVLASNVWKAESVPIPHLTYESQLVAGSSLALSPLICPEQPAVPSSRSAVAVEKEKHESMFKYPQRRRRLNIFPSIKSEIKYAKR